VKIDSASCECAGDLRHAARLAVRQPFAGAGLGIFELRRWLKVENQNRPLGALDRGQYLAAGRIRRHVTTDQIDIFANEAIACSSGGGLIVHHADIHNSRVKLVELSSHKSPVRREPILQPRELRPICGQPDAEEADFAWTAHSIESSVMYYTFIARCVRRA